MGLSLIRCITHPLPVQPQPSATQIARQMPSRLLVIAQPGRRVWVRGAGGCDLADVGGDVGAVGSLMTIGVVRGSRDYVC